MNYFQAVTLGVIQGVTEFLPISSDGHLAIAQNFFGLTENILSFDVFLHLGTLVAVIMFFWPDLIKLKFKDWVLVGVGTIPAVFVGLLVKDSIEAIASSMTAVAGFLILSGIFNFISHLMMKKPATNEAVTPLKALIIGIFQASAIMPGLSRSGSTMMSSLVMKMDKQAAFKFSFFLAVPAILGAVVLQSLDLYQTGLGTIDIGSFLVGGLAAVLTGILSLKLLSYVVNKANFAVFGWYCLILGGGILLSQII